MKYFTAFALALLILAYDFWRKPLMGVDKICDDEPVTVTNGKEWKFLHAHKNPYFHDKPIIYKHGGLRTPTHACRSTNTANMCDICGEVIRNYHWVTIS